MAITGSSLKRLRLDAELTQRKLAELVGVSQAHISKIESEKVDPRLSTVNKVLQILAGGERRSCKEVMTKRVVSVKPADKIFKVSELMIKHAISQLPVIHSKRVIGTVTEESIIRNLAQPSRTRELRTLCSRLYQVFQKRQAST
jgi:predicted transcriptional regulator